MTTYCTDLIPNRFITVPQALGLLLATGIPLAVLVAAVVWPEPNNSPRQRRKPIPKDAINQWLRHE